MFNFAKYCFYISIFISAVISFNVPKDVQPCSQSDPKINDCVVKMTNLLIPELENGAPEYKIPKLNPLIIPEIAITSNNLNFTFTDAHVFGIDQTTVKSVKMDLKNQLVEATFSIPRLNIQTKYTIKGVILVLPISGSGPANLTAVEGTYPGKLSYKLYEKNGKKYAKIEKITVDYDIKRAHIQLDNLFNGNKELSDQMNDALNKNWKEVLQEVGPALTEAVAAIIKVILSGVFDKVSFDTLFTA